MILLSSLRAVMTPGSPPHQKPYNYSGFLGELYLCKWHFGGFSSQKWAVWIIIASKTSFSGHMSTWLLFLKLWTHSLKTHINQNKAHSMYFCRPVAFLPCFLIHQIISRGLLPLSLTHQLSSASLFSLASCHLTGADLSLRRSNNSVMTNESFWKQNKTSIFHQAAVRVV